MANLGDITREGTVEIAARDITKILWNELPEKPSRELIDYYHRVIEKIIVTYLRSTDGSNQLQLQSTGTAKTKAEILSDLVGRFTDYRKRFTLRKLKLVSPPPAGR